MHILAFAIALHTAATAPSSEPGAGKVRLAILGLRNDGVDAHVVNQVVDALALRLSKRAGLQVLTSTEIQAVLGLEAAKQVFECHSSTSCTAIDEVTKGLDVQYVLAGSIAPRGANAVNVNASLVDVKKGVPVSRSAAEVALDDLDDDLAPITDDVLHALFRDAPSTAGAALLSSQKSSELPVLTWVGVGVAGLGALGAGTGAVLWGIDDSTIRAGDTKFGAKEEARSRYVVDEAVAASGAGVVVIGAALLVVGLVAGGT